MDWPSNNASNELHKSAEAATLPQAGFTRRIPKHSNTCAFLCFLAEHFTGCKIRRVDEKMKCSKTCQNDLKTCQNECEYYSEAEFDSEMPSKLCFIRFLLMLGLIFCIEPSLSYSLLNLLLGIGDDAKLRPKAKVPKHF